MNYLQKWLDKKSKFVGKKNTRADIFCYFRYESPKKDGEVVRRGIDEKWWPSVIFYMNRQARCSVNNLISRHKTKLEKLPERQDRPLKNLDESAVRILDEVVLPLWVW